MTTELLLTLLGYAPGEPYPSLLGVKLRGLAYYDAEVIYETVKNCAEAIQWSFEHKNFESTQHKIFYMFAIISNKIGDINKQITYQNKMKMKDVSTEQHINQIVDIENIGTTKRGNDISSFLED